MPATAWAWPPRRLSSGTLWSFRVKTIASPLPRGWTWKTARTVGAWTAPNPPTGHRRFSWKTPPTQAESSWPCNPAKASPQLIRPLEKQCGTTQTERPPFLPASPPKAYCWCLHAALRPCVPDPIPTNLKNYGVPAGFALLRQARLCLAIASSSSIKPESSLAEICATVKGSGN